MECSSCGALYNKSCGCSKGSLVDKFIRDTNKTSDSSQRPPQDCVKCGNPVEGLNCQGCALWRKKLKEVWFTICHENGIYQDLLNTYGSSDDNTNVVNAPQEPFVKEEDRRIAEDQAAKDRYWKIPICYDDDEDYTIAITPVLSTEDPVDSLIMEDEHLDAIPAIELDEVIKSSVENLVLTLSESEGILDKMCDVPLCNNPTPLEAFKEHSEIVVDFNDDSTLSDDDSPYGEDIDYVDASPPDFELVSLEVVENVTPEDGEIEDDILHEKISKINLLIAKIEAMNSNPPPSSDFVTKSSSQSYLHHIPLGSLRHKVRQKLSNIIKPQSFRRLQHRPRLRQDVANIFRLR
ncbi:hypothetical protein Tco_0595910 [Tanacetum coccineum]